MVARQLKGEETGPREGKSPIRPLARDFVLESGFSSSLARDEYEAWCSERHERCDGLTLLGCAEIMTRIIHETASLTRRSHTWRAATRIDRTFFRADLVLQPRHICAVAGVHILLVDQWPHQSMIVNRRRNVLSKEIQIWAGRWPLIGAAIGFARRVWRKARLLSLRTGSYGQQ